MEHPAEQPNLFLERLTQIVERQSQAADRPNHSPGGRIVALIPAYDEARFSGSLVLAAAAYVDEVIVIDNGSRDRTVEIAERAGATVIQYKHNQGKAVYLDRPDLINTCGNTVHYTGLTYCRGAGQPQTNYMADAEVDAVSGAACAIRRALFADLGGFDERFFMYVEDTDLSWRARLAGYRCLYVHGAVVAHNYRPSYSPAKAFYLDRNRHLMLLKNLGRATYLRLLPGLLPGELVTWGFLLLKGPRYWAVKPRVYRRLWAERGAIRAARRAVRPNAGGAHDRSPGVPSACRPAPGPAGRSCVPPGILAGAPAGYLEIRD